MPRPTRWIDEEPLARNAFTDPDAAMLDALEPVFAGRAIGFLAKVRKYDPEPHQLLDILWQCGIAPGWAGAICDVYRLNRVRPLGGFLTRCETGISQLATNTSRTSD